MSETKRPKIKQLAGNTVLELGDRVVDAQPADDESLIAAGLSRRKAAQESETNAAISAAPSAYPLTLLGSYPHVPATHTKRIAGIDFRFEPGVYVIGAPTRSGKSLTMLALHSALFNIAKEDSGVSCAYFNVFEPTSTVGVIPNFGEGKARLLFRPGRSAFFLDGDKTAKDTRGDFIRWAAGVGLPETYDTSRLTFAIFDSITDAIMNFRADLRSGQRTFKGGGQPMDAQFLRELHSECVARSIAFFGVVNSSVLPINASFEGVVAGVGEVTSPGRMILRGRADGRVARNLSFSKQEVDAVAPLLGYRSNTSPQTKNSFSSVFKPI